MGNLRPIQLAIPIVVLVICSLLSRPAAAEPLSGSCFSVTGRARLGAVVCAPLLGCKGGLSTKIYGRWYTATVGVPRGKQTGEMVNFAGRVCGESFTAWITG